mmetsp:Transcript_33685/g.84567  ORF Transcript_33685/g.84567 Transcript_33685/m.84567 type:complete len:238 (+) Transcript_33685:288-1001(+)
MEVAKAGLPHARLVQLQPAQQGVCLRAQELLKALPLRPQALAVAPTRLVAHALHRSLLCQVNDHPLILGEKVLQGLHRTGRIRRTALTAVAGPRRGDVRPTLRCWGVPVDVPLVGVRAVGQCVGAAGEIHAPKQGCKPAVLLRLPVSVLQRRHLGAQEGVVHGGVVLHDGAVPLQPRVDGAHKRVVGGRHQRGGCVTAHVDPLAHQLSELLQHLNVVCKRGVACEGCVLAHVHTLPG